MAGADDDSEKSHEPTQQKLDDARKKGEVARSADLITAGVYGGMLLTALAFGKVTIESAGINLKVIFDQAPELSDQLFQGSASPLIGGLMGGLALALAAWFIIPAVAAILSAVAQQAFIIAPSKIKPKLSRINPISNAKNKYGPSGLFEFAKSFVKLVCFSAVLGVFLSYRLSEMAGSLHGEPMIVGALMVSLLTDFMFVVVLITVAIGAVDFLWQRHDHMRRNRMSFQDVKDEHKQHEGDPHMKQKRRQMAASLVSGQQLADVQTADVVLVNPTHYSVALKWSRETGSAPICVAKGEDHAALKIREIATEHGVPIRSDPPTARAIYATTEVGQEIAPDMYRPVAAAIRFAEAMRRKARSFGR